MSELPGDLLYTNDHEWLRRESDGSVTVGITEHAATALGDLFYVELPEIGQDVDAAIRDRWCRGDLPAVHSLCFSWCFFL